MSKTNYMIWPVQGTPREKLTEVVSQLLYCFTALQAQYERRPDYIEIATNAELLKSVAAEYGITFPEICRLIVEIAPAAAEKLRTENTSTEGKPSMLFSNLYDE